LAQTILLDYVGSLDQLDKKQYKILTRAEFICVPEFSSTPFCIHARAHDSDAVYDESCEPNSVSLLINSLQHVKETQLLVLYGIRTVWDNKEQKQQYLGTIVGFTYCLDALLITDGTRLQTGDVCDVGDQPETEPVVRVPLCSITRRSLQQTLQLLATDPMKVVVDDVVADQQEPPHKMIAIPAKTMTFAHCEVPVRLFLKRMQEHMLWFFQIRNTEFFTSSPEIWKVDQYCLLFLAAAASASPELQAQFLERQAQKYSAFFYRIDVSEHDKKLVLRDADLLQTYLSTLAEDARCAHNNFDGVLKQIKHRNKVLLRAMAARTQAPAPDSSALDSSAPSSSPSNSSPSCSSDPGASSSAPPPRHVLLDHVLKTFERYAAANCSEK
jgi:hypothetical protein